MRYFILLFIFTGLSFCGLSQNRESFTIDNSGITPPNKRAEDGKIELSQDVLLRRAVKRHVEINNNQFEGWRVQIYFGSGKTAMGEAQSYKKRFLTRYGNDHGAYIDFDTPNFKVKVGDFRTKAEAMYFKSVIEKTFPNSWVLRDRVNYPLDSNSLGENNESNDNDNN
jgi:hypothetical protein